MSSIAALQRQVAEASRILAGEGLLDAFGHVSVRHPSDAGRFLLPRSMAPALVTPNDVIEHDLDGDMPSESTAKPFVERFIHAEIYRRRADVGAIVHSHSLAVLPFTVVPEVRVRPIFHMCGHLEGTPAPFDIADFAGPSSDLLVRNPEIGRALAGHLGEAAVVLMRGHGFTAAGPDLPQAVYRAVYTARNCEVQQAAMALGDPRYLSSREADACAGAAATQVGRAWAMWQRRHAADLA